MRGNAGFTLTELIVVILIAVILMALLFPAFETMQGYGKRTRCMSQLRQVFQVITAYIGENDLKYPPCFSAAPAASPDPGVPGSSYWIWYSSMTGSNAESPLASYTGGVSGLHQITICPLNKTVSSQKLSGGLYGFPYTVNYHVMATTGFPIRRVMDFPHPESMVLMIDSVTGPTWGWGFSSPASGWQRVAESHRSKANILWCDGHVTHQLKSEITPLNCTGY